MAYDLVEYGYVKGAYLGISLRDLDSNTASYYSLPVGPRVESVTEGSCAETAGVQVGDIIIGFNGVDVESYNDLAGQLKKVNAGDTVEMVVYRSGEEVTLTVTLPAGTEDRLNAALAEATAGQVYAEVMETRFMGRRIK